MKLQTIRLRGAIGIKHGLDRDEIEVNFQDFGPGLVAIVGRNGSGKTSLVDQCQPYRSLMSRKGSLQHHFFLRDSFRDVTCELGNDVIRSLINIDAKTEKQEACLYKNGVPLNRDMKTSTYDTAVEELFGSEDMYRYSYFSAQGAESLVSAKESKQKELYYELLGLLRYDAYAGFAKGRADEHEKQILQMSGQLLQVKNEIADRAVIESEITRLTAEAEEIAHRIPEVETILKEHRDELMKLEGLRATHEEKRSQLNGLEIQFMQLNDQLAAVVEKYNDELRSLNKQKEKLEAEIVRKKKVLEHKTNIDASLATLELLTQQEGEWTEKERRLRAVEKEEYEEKQRYQEEAHKRQKRVFELQRTFSDVAASLNSLEEKMAQTAQEIERQLAEARLASLLIDEVPAASGLPCSPPQCTLLVNANAAKERIPGLEQQLELARTGYRNNGDYRILTDDKRRAEANLKTAEEAQLQLQLQMVVFTEEKEAIGYNEQVHSLVRRQLTELKKHDWQALHTECIAAESAIQEKQGQLDSLLAMVTKTNGAMDLEVGSLNTRLKEVEEKRAQVQKALVEFSTIGIWIDKCKQSIEQLEGILSAHRSTAANIQASLRVEQSKIERIDKLEAQVIQLEQDIKSNAEQTQYWRILQQACSKDGIPALELDAAGPELSRYGSDLLSGSFGLGWGIRFETQHLSADKKKMIEEFRIICFTPQGEKKVEDMSGGEKVWVIRAIADAFACYNNQKRVEQGKAPILTRFMDEVDGQLDKLPDESGLSSRDRYWQLVNESHKMMALYQTFAITHDPEVWERIPQRIHFEDGGIQLI